MINDTVKQFIEKVLTLIEDPEHFTSLWFAKDAEGKSVMWDNEGAVKFDLIGAMERVGMDDLEGKSQTYEEINRVLEYKNIRLVNFTRELNHSGIIGFLRGIITGSEEPSIVEAPCPAVELQAKKKRGRPRKATI